MSPSAGSSTRRPPREEGELVDRRDHRPFLDELLNPMKGGLALGPVELSGLLPEEAVDVGIPSIGEGAARDRI